MAEGAELKAAAQRALKLMDFTTLADDDTHERVEKLCADARWLRRGGRARVFLVSVAPFGDAHARTRARGTSTPFGCTAAVCIYAQFVGTAKKALQANGTPQVRVATVVNFPHGGDDVEKAVQETRDAVAAGADEIDVVLPYKRLIAGDEDVCKELVARVKAECTGPVLLKVIIETGELKEPALIRCASEIAIGAGADFIKTVCVQHARARTRTHTHTHKPTRTHTRENARTRARAHTHSHAQTHAHTHSPRGRFL